MSLLFSVAIRLKIVVELYARPMSPTEFFEEFGGGSPERVAQHFAVLEKHGWLRRVGYRPRESGRRGRTETLYRATELAFFDTETWALVPYSARLTTSWGMLKATAREVCEGIEAAAMEERPCRDLSCTTLELDAVGWEQAIAILDSGLSDLLEEQEDTKVRAAHGGEALIRAGVLQIGFEASRGAGPAGSRLAEASVEPLVPVPERLAPILADDLCMEILTVLNERKMSVKGFNRECAAEASESAVRHRFERLRKLGWITVVEKVRKRAVEEYIYMATRPSTKNDDPWGNVREEVRQTESWSNFERLCVLARASIASGAFDLRADRHVSWSIVHIDRDGWKKTVANMESMAGQLRRVEEDAKRRVADGAEPLAMVVGLSVLESPISREKAP